MSKKLSVKDRAMLAMQTPTAALPSNADTVRMKTGPGAFVAHLAKESEVFSENKLLRSELETWTDASPAKKLDPSHVVPSKWANRHDDSFTSSRFVDLKADIQSSGGNVQAIKVRPIPGADPQRYEIVFGHRRHRACLDLDLPVLAVIESINEQALFEEMDRENRQRADLRPYEQGVMYARAVDEGLYPSLRKMAEALCVEPGNASKVISLARLPAEVLAAFNSPLDLQQNWAPVLTQALQKNPDLVLERARVLSETTPRPKASEIFKSLIDLTSVVSDNTLKNTPVLVEGNSGQTGRIKYNPKKKTFEINLTGVADFRLADIEEAIKALLS